MKQRICTVEDCGKKCVGRGWCEMHYSRWRRYGDPYRIGRVVYGEALDRFRAKVTRDEEGCWLWGARLNASGYGVFTVDGEPVLAHRWAYGHFIGPIPPTLTIDHLCEVTRCVNPEHLEPISIQENVKRSSRHYGARTHCPQGHEFSEENTRVRPDGGRRCLACKREWSRRSYKRKRLAA